MSFEQPHKNNICAIIVTYHPDKDLPQRVSKILPQVDRVILVDNNSNPEAKKMLHDLAQQEQILLIKNKQNLGIAAALNRGVTWANEYAYKWFLTFDQDTTAESFMVDALTETLDTIHFKDKIAIIGANYVVSNSCRTIENYGGVNAKKWVEKKTLITSGSLTSLDIHNNIGHFRDEFFIDAVDHDYCLRARSKGYKFVMVLKPLMKHPIGERAIHIPLFNFYTFDHSPYRRYYITRNAIILFCEYLMKDPAWAVQRFIRMVGSIMLMFFL